MNQIKSIPKYQRRNFYIDKNFQTKFIIKFWSITAIAAVLTVFVIYRFAQNTTTVGIINGHVAVHTTAEYLLPLLLQTVGVVAIFVSLMTIGMTLFISHKIAGPAYRFKVALKNLGDGDLGSIHLRQGDQMQIVADSYNEAMKKLNNKIKTAKSASSLEEAKKILDTFKLS